MRAHAAAVRPGLNRALIPARSQPIPRVVCACPQARAVHCGRAPRRRCDTGLREAAAAALATAALERLDGAGMSDGVQLMERAVALGYRQPDHLLTLAQRLNDADCSDAALAILDHLPALPAGSRQEAERVHVGAYALIGRDPAAAIEGFDRAAELWHSQGDVEKEGWAHANKGLALLSLGAVDRAGEELD